jgi:hypothetical protein
MLSNQKVSSERVTTFVEQTAAAELEIGNSRFGIGIIMAMAGFVGAWGFICLLNGIAQSHNLHVLGRGIITAFIGI